MTSLAEAVKNEKTWVRITETKDERWPHAVLIHAPRRAFCEPIPGYEWLRGERDGRQNHGLNVVYFSRVPVLRTGP